jgi:hypothetical protein
MCNASIISDEQAALEKLGFSFTWLRRTHPLAH